MIQFPCPHCRALHQTAGANKGSFACFRCGELMYVSRASKGETNIAPAASTIVNRDAVRMGTPAVQRPIKVRGKARCVDCQAPLKVHAPAGKNVQCPMCTSWFCFEPAAAT